MTDFTENELELRRVYYEAWKLEMAKDLNTKRAEIAGLNAVRNYVVIEIISNNLNEKDN